MNSLQFNRPFDREFQKIFPAVMLECVLSFCDHSVGMFVYFSLLVLGIKLGDFLTF